MQGKINAWTVIRKVWGIYVDQASVLMPAAAVVFATSGILAQVLSESGSFGGVLLASLIRLVATTLFTAMIVELVADVQDGRRDSTAGQLIRAISPVLGQLILVGLIAGILILIGLFLLVVPGLILITIWSVFVPVIVIERAPGLSSLSRSRELVRGNGGEVFAVLLVLLVLVGAFSLAAAAVAASASTGAGIVVQVVLGVLTAPLGALASAVLYFELGGRRTQPGAVAGSEARPARGEQDAGPNPFGGD